MFTISTNPLSLLHRFFNVTAGIKSFYYTFVPCGPKPTLTNNFNQIQMFAPSVIEYTIIPNQPSNALPLQDPQTPAIP